MNTPVPTNVQSMPLDEIYRQYGEATIQLKLAQGKVMMLEQQIQASLNQPVR